MNLFSSAKRVQLVAAVVLLSMALVWVVYEALVRPRLTGPLVAAAAAGDQAAVRRLLWWGADVNFKTVLDTPLVAAVRAGHIGTAALLLDHGADVNRGPILTTALNTAVERNDLPMIRLLLERGASLQGADGQFALSLALGSGNRAVLQFLLDQGAYPDVGVLGSAAAQGRPAVVRFLLDRGANAADQNELRQTALMLMAGNGLYKPVPARDCAAIVDLLVARGANVNARDVSGRTALLLAAQKGNTGLVRALLDHGTDPNVTADAGWTALNRAAGHPEIITLLKKAGARR